MGVRCRVFLIEHNDSLQRICMVRLNRLLNFDRRERFQRCAGKRVRCALVFVEVAGRRVLAIQNIDYIVLTFDAKGQISRKEWEKGMRLGMDLLPSIPDEKHSKQVIDARHRFAKRRYEHEFKWKPSRKLEQAIVTTVFSGPVTTYRIP